MSELLLDIKDLVVEYTSNDQIVHAVNGISLKLNRGESLGLVGETGAGKTTVAKAILRILPDMSAHIKSGEIFFENQDLLSMPLKDIQKVRGNKISMIFQDPMTALNPIKSVGKQIAAVVELHSKLSKKDAWKKAEDMLEMVGIRKERATEFPHQFSGGMKQRVVIAMALACHPDLILADEPTTALDVTIQAQILETISELKVKSDVSMLLITHDFGIVAENCEKVAVIYAGKIVEYGTVYEVLKNPIHPYTIGLLNAIPDVSSKTEWLKPIEGLPPNPADLPEGCVFNPRCPYATEECRKNMPDMRNYEGTHNYACLRNLHGEKEKA